VVVAGSIGIQAVRGSCGHEGPVRAEGRQHLPKGRIHVEGLLDRVICADDIEDERTLAARAPSVLQGLVSTDPGDPLGGDTFIRVPLALRGPARAEAVFDMVDAVWVAQHGLVKAVAVRGVAQVPVDAHRTRLPLGVAAQAKPVVAMHQREIAGAVGVKVVDSRTGERSQQSAHPWAEAHPAQAADAYATRFTCRLPVGRVPRYVEPERRPPTSREGRFHSTRMSSEGSACRRHCSIAPLAKICRRRRRLPP
jgi:hypothetical protein